MGVGAFHRRDKMALPAPEYANRQDNMTRVFNLVDNLGTRDAVSVFLDTCAGDQVAISAGGPPPYRFWPATPPFFSFQVALPMESHVAIPAAWVRFLAPDDGEGHYLLVPRLLITHLISSSGGLIKATYQRVGLA
jgi:hypothetical protein